MTIARQLGLDPSTVSNFFMNARRRSVDKWKDDSIIGGGATGNADDDEDEDEEDHDEVVDGEALSPPDDHIQHHHQASAVHQPHHQTVTLARFSAVDGQVKTGQAVLCLPAAAGDLTPTSLGSAASLDL